MNIDLTREELGCIVAALNFTRTRTNTWNAHGFPDEEILVKLTRLSHEQYLKPERSDVTVSIVSLKKEVGELIDRAEVGVHQLWAEIDSVDLEPDSPEWDNFATLTHIKNLLEVAHELYPYPYETHTF